MKRHWVAGLRRLSLKRQQLLFVGCAVGKVSIEKVSRALIPFYVTMVVVLMLVTFVPEVVMFIPNLLM